MKNGIISISLAVALVLSVCFIGCGSEEVPEITEYNLTISSTEGGEVTSPGAGTFAYDEVAVVNLVAEAEEGYRFVNWTGDVDTIANVNAASTTITMNGDYEISANFEAIPPGKYSLTIRSTRGGSVTSPGPGTFTDDKGTIVNLVATPISGYQFIKWTGDIDTVANISAASTTIAMNGHYTITANFGIGIYDWHDLDAIRNNLGGRYILMNDLDSTTPGYVELAGPAANGGKGWQPIGSLSVDPSMFYNVNPVDLFTGSLDGQGYEIGDLFIGRSDEDGVGLFGCVGGVGVVENLGVTNVNVAGRSYVGGLVGSNVGAVSNSHSTGSVTGTVNVGGLAGNNAGPVSNSYSGSGVTGSSKVGGLVGFEYSATLSNSYSTGSATGSFQVGGLVGEHHEDTVSNSYYSYDHVLINGRNIITIGALSNEDFEQWLANNKSLDTNKRLSQQNGYYLINNVNDFKQLLAFGQDGALKFRLKNDLDLGDEPNFYIPYLAGEFDGNGHKIANLSFSFDSITQVGLFGYLASGGSVTGVSAENVNIAGRGGVGGLVGENDGTVSNSYSTGRVAGYWAVGGLAGLNSHGIMSNSYYNYDEVLINGQKVITIGALFDRDFDEWLANGKHLDINQRLSQKDGYYLINNVNDFKQLLAFGQNDTLMFRLTNDLDLSGDPNFYIPYLAGEFDGNGHKISNLKLNFNSVAQVGLFGYLDSRGKVNKVGVENVNLAVTGSERVGGLVGGSVGTVNSSYSSGGVTGKDFVGGLVGRNDCIVSNSYSTSSVTGLRAGGLIGWNHGGAVSNSYSIGSVTGSTFVRGLVQSGGGTVNNSFWDTETSGQSTSAGGIGKTTAEMKSISTFTGAGWNTVAVANPNVRNLSYIWNIVDGQTYPFLSWQSVS